MRTVIIVMGILTVIIMAAFGYLFITDDSLVSGSFYYLIGFAGLGLGAIIVIRFMSNELDNQQ